MMSKICELNTCLIRNLTNSFSDTDQRYYSNQFGRFMTPDPYQASGGPQVPLSWNRYSYVIGDPINLFDPRGTQYCFIDPNSGQVVSCYDSVDVTATVSPLPYIAVSLPNLGYTPGDAGAKAKESDSDVPDSKEAASWIQHQKQRFDCAAKFGQANSLAALLWPGSQNSFLGNLIGGNAISGIENLASIVFGVNNNPNGADILTIILNGAGQGIPSSDPGVSGATGQTQTALSKIVINAFWNSVTGVNVQITELGLNGRTIATSLAPLSSGALDTLASYVGLGKLVFDLGTFATGYFSACP